MESEKKIKEFVDKFDELIDIGKTSENSECLLITSALLAIKGALFSGNQRELFDLMAAFSEGEVARLTALKN